MPDISVVASLSTANGATYSYIYFGRATVLSNERIGKDAAPSSKPRGEAVFPRPRYNSEIDAAAEAGQPLPEAAWGGHIGDRP